MTTTYDPAKVDMILNGVRLTGFASGTFISIEYNADSWSTQVGADGEAVRSKSNDQSAQVTVTVLPGSPANAILGGLKALDDADNRGAAACMIKDPHSNTVHLSEGMYVKKEPNTVYAVEGQAKEWTLETGRLKAAHGASTEAI